MPFRYHSCFDSQRLIVRFPSFTHEAAVGNLGSRFTWNMSEQQDASPGSSLDGTMGPASRVTLPIVNLDPI